MTTDEAIRALETLGFERNRQVGSTTTMPSDEHLTFRPGCCHGWVEIRGSHGLFGPVELRVDKRNEFTLQFASLSNLVEHLALWYRRDDR